jgi:metal transporter CNNM
MGHEAECEEETLPLWSAGWFMYAGIVFALTCSAGICSGLTVGMLSINKLNLALKQKAGTDKEKHMAEQLLPILNQHHLLLATLLLANAGCMESLPIFLDALVPAWAAILISTSLVLVFGEVIPQAYCTGPNQLQIATFMIPVVKTLICITYPITWPIAYCLDVILGHESDLRYDKKNLKTLIELHMGEGRLTEEEITIIKATIDLRETTVESIMIPIKDVFKLSDRTIISQDMLTQIIKRGFTRIPIYAGNDIHEIKDVISAKSLLTALSQSGILLGNLTGAKPHPIRMITRDCNLQEALTLFQEHRVNMMFISDAAKEVKVIQKDTAGKILNPPSVIFILV